MANLIVVCGPQAVGKMTVAESICKKIPYRLMTNHDSIEAAIRIFGLGTGAWTDFSGAFRQKAFETAIRHNIDLIFTYVCAFDIPEDRQHLLDIAGQFTQSGGNFYLVELYAELETRILRNETPHRLEMKPSKRNIEWSRNNLLEDAQKYRLNSDKDDLLCEHHLKIDNTHLSPDEVADIVIAHFGLKAQ